MPPEEGSTKPDLSALRIADSARRSGGGSVRWLRWMAAALGVVVLVTGAIFALRPRTPEITLAAVKSGGASKPVLLNASGYVTPRRRATVAAKITARVEQIYADEGMRVREGEVLAELDCSDARVRLRSAEADRDATAAALQDLRVNLANADRELRRTQALEAGGVMSQQALDLTRTTAESLRARIAMTQEQTLAADARIRVARQDVDNCTVRSPFAGIVVSKDAQRGEMVSPISAGGGFTRTGIATVVDMNSLEVEVDVNESYIARVKPGQPVTAILDAYPDWEIPAKVRTVIPSADRQKATVKVRIAFDKLDPRILPDMGVKVRFLGEQPSSGQAAQALIPKRAVREDSNANYVFVYRDGHVERRAVRAGSLRGDDQEILAGLAEGDQVVTDTSGPLRDGQRVEVRR